MPHNSAVNRRGGSCVRVRVATPDHARRVIYDNCGGKISRPFLTKLEGAADVLFEFVLDPNVPPANNAAERGLR